jgi:hypothetical protein
MDCDARVVVSRWESRVGVANFDSKICGLSVVFLKIGWQTI